MDILYLLVPISILLIFVIGVFFWWALNNRQFDALDEVSERILKDPDTPVNNNATRDKDQPKA
jgi:cbb3-type cytochrome oxidase maturation protein